MANTTQNKTLSTMSVFTRLYRNLSKIFKSQADELVIPINIKTDLCHAQASRREKLYTDRALPGSLLQAFTEKPLVTGDMRFIGREEQSTRLLSAIEMWQSGQTSMLAVTGPQGCGISSFLQQIPQHISDQQGWHYSELTRRPTDNEDCLAQLSNIVGSEQPIASVAELIDYINTLPPGIFAIDNGHYLASRIMGSNQAIRTFGAVMVATQQRHLWILGCQEFAWRRLAYLYNADRYFTELIGLTLFSEDELKQCLSSRLQVSGILLNSDTSNEQTESPSVLGQLFSTLYKLSNGKPDIAFFYLLGSMNFNAEDKLWDIQPVEQLDFNQLKQLVHEELFTLAEISAHGQLSIDDHQSIFRSSHEESWLLLERLYHQCLLDKTTNDNVTTYHLVPLYSDVITRFLNNANYLY
ncbi:MAG: ATP-binding protein [Gammaproteobacteria bacterium]|nr:ATP-binding protein [Gammaproteobacteria bacterium]